MKGFFLIIIVFGCDWKGDNHVQDGVSGVYNSVPAHFLEIQVT